MVPGPDVHLATLLYSNDTAADIPITDWKLLQQQPAWGLTEKMQKAACPNDLDQARPTCTPHVAPQDHELKHYYVIFSHIFHEMIVCSTSTDCKATLCRGGHRAVPILPRVYHIHSVKSKPTCYMCLCHLVSKMEWLLIIFRPTYMCACLWRHTIFVIKWTCKMF